jgi:GNAT superfamily N-acetyltransferase
MNAGPSIIRLNELPADRLADLVAESEAAGLALVRRLVDDWDSGANRFDRTGEALFAAILDGRVVGVCGLNVDPYTTAARVGRVRHLYVASDCRRRGLGARLVAAVVEAAASHFDRLRLRTHGETAARFYKVLGFRPCSEGPDCTHVLELAV